MDYAKDQRTPFMPKTEQDMRELGIEVALSYPSSASDAPTATIIPITQERTPMNLNTDDANSVSSFFQSLADKVVLASTLPAKVEELSKVVDALKADVEAYREHNARMDEEITNLRRERQQLQDENATLRSELSRKIDDHHIAEERWGQACQERDRWHNDYISLSSAHEDVKRERDDAQMKIMELEDKLARTQLDATHWQDQASALVMRLDSIRSALA